MDDLRTLECGGLPETQIHEPEPELISSIDQQHFEVIPEPIPDLRTLECGGLPETQIHEHIPDLVTQPINVISGGNFSLGTVSKSLLAASRISPNNNGVKSYPKGITVNGIGAKSDHGVKIGTIAPKIIDKSKGSSDSSLKATGGDGSDGDSSNENLTSGQKWWAAIILGLIFFIISSPCAYAITSAASTSLGGMALSHGGPNIPGLILHTLIFILIIRLILW